MIHRIGTFLIFVGALLVGLFILSDLAETPTCGFLLSGSTLLALGIYLWFRDPVERQPTERFRLLRGAQKKQEEKK